LNKNIGFQGNPVMVIKSSDAVYLVIKYFNSISLHYFSERTCGSGEEGDSKGEPGETSEEGKEYL
jgi:hypothetical protein